MADNVSDASEEESFATSSPSDDELSSPEERGGRIAVPYQFEPRIVLDYSQYSSSDDDEHDESNAECPRVENTAWCSCTNCVVMPEERECLCCMEIVETKQKVSEYYTEMSVPLTCITQHPGFATVCLDRYVLEVAYFQYREQYGEMANMDDRWRYVGYRQLARWCWGFLGKNVRVVLPACAVTKIRETFPSQSYKGFEEA